MVLAEHALTDHDVERIATLHDPEPVTVHMIGPAGKSEPDTLAALEASVRALREAGVAADGEPVGRDPVDKVVAAVRRLDADEVLVITEPHPLQEALHRDWASRIRGELDRPVLHVLAGTDQVVS